MQRLIFTTLFFSVINTLFAQSQPKQLSAQRLTGSIKIDGSLDDKAWKEAIPAKDFVEWRPNSGAPEAYTNRTEIYFLYDNSAVYVGGYCHERTSDSVSRELVGRDVVGVNDFVGVIFDTYFDKINGVGFYVTALGEQFDAKYSPTLGEDASWNAVWDSESKIVSDGWTFEMRIPYSALRFNSKDVQTWGLNITRRRNKTGQQYMWNPVDPKVNGFINQEGSWTNIERINAPIRLSFSPYLSTYVNHYPHNTEGVHNTTASVNGGMDVKYGINESFTLDMTLIPDFGQVQSDNQVLNLSPFEVKYNENRSFFTEGTELFNKGGLFYSRRIGAAPLHYYDVEDTSTDESHIHSNEHFIKNPSETKLLNATKISGRTRHGLGIGFFNAITEPMYAEVEDDAHNTRKIQTSPLTNYNIMVLDQSLKNNSSVSLINTSVIRNGPEYDANVTAGLFDFNNKKNTYNWNGKFAVSQILQNGKNQIGYSHFLGFGKTGGRFNFNMTQDLTTNNYQINDLGILFNNNYLDHYLWLGYKWVKPTKWFNSMYLNYNFYYSRRYQDNAFQYIQTNVNANGQLKNLYYVGIFVRRVPKGNDFYEPRETGRVYKSPAHTDFQIWMESNNAKKYSFGAQYNFAFYEIFKGRQFMYDIFQNYRFNDHISIGHEINYKPSLNEAGYTDTHGSEIIFARRDRQTVENILKAKYNFNNRSGISFRARHYWSKVINKEFFNLNNNGSITHTGSYIGNTDQNYNAFTIDAVYTLQFAPGSFINLVWKNAIYTNNDQVQYRYMKNFDQTISAPQNNNFSVKVIYYLDYLTLKKK